ncbi:MAG TPA: hypothetical protein VGF97_06400 [Rhizomicrobium sp.]
MADERTRQSGRARGRNARVDDHYMSLEQTRLRVLQDLKKFLAANIGN